MTLIKTSLFKQTVTEENGLYKITNHFLVEGKKHSIFLTKTDLVKMLNMSNGEDNE